MLCFSIVLCLRGLGKSAPKNERVRRIGCPRRRQNLRESGSEIKILKKKNKMKPTNPNADTYVEEQKQYL